MAAGKPQTERLVIGGHAVAPGTRADLDLAAARLPTQTVIDIPVVALHGARTGPRLWLTAAVHGDELNGVEIIRRVLERLDPTKLAGTLIAVPIVNVFGFIAGNRYLPDRRDLNRSFPGSATGSLASSLAHILVRDVVAGSTHGIDLHTGSLDRSNLPQVRADLGDAETRRMARAFAAPVTLSSRGVAGTLRHQSWEKLGIPTLLFEGGRALRFDDDAIAVGTAGVLGVMAALKMIPRAPAAGRRGGARARTITESSWLRARVGGIARLESRLGEVVRQGQRMGVIGNAYGIDSLTIVAPRPGIVIGKADNPVVHKGDPLFHLGTLARPSSA